MCNGTLKKIMVIVSVAVCGFQVAHANPNAEQVVFGNQSTKQGNQLQRRKVLKANELKTLMKSAINGNVNAANKIKEYANYGDREAALQYGYLAHIGKLPGVGTDYAKAMQAYRKATRQKDQNGQEIGFLANHLAAYNIGVMYQNGQGVGKNAAEAYHWFKISNDAYQERHPNQVFFPAAVHMARALQSGVGVARDDKQALKLWDTIVRFSGLPEAFVRYADMVLMGRGTPKNPAVAISYYKRAADRWSLEGIEKLAMLQTKGGVGIEPNLAEAAKWYIVLANVNRKFAGKERTALGKLKTDKERKYVQTLAMSWLSTHGTMPEPFDFSKPLNEDPQKF